MGFGLYGYLAAALIVAATLAGTFYKGYTSGKDTVMVEWHEANNKARAEAETERQKQEQLQRDQAKTLEETLAKLRKVKREKAPVVEKHIVEAAIPAECKLTDSLLNDWNAGNSGQSDASGSVPGPAGPTSSVNRSDDTGAGKESSGGGLRIPQPGR